MKQKHSICDKEVQETLAKPDKTLWLVSEGPHSEPSQPDIPMPSTPLDMIEMIKEQANPTAPAPPLEWQLEESLQTITADPPGLQEQNQPVTTT